jgi:hypothetical protein
MELRSDLARLHRPYGVTWDGIGGVRVSASETERHAPGVVWNRISNRTRANVIETALVHTELSPRELA